jgi:hypothetical protein
LSACGEASNLELKREKPNCKHALVYPSLLRSRQNAEEKRATAGKPIFALASPKPLAGDMTCEPVG